jgi:UDP-N-acetylglucosamine--N-acetylmuramyl-(pentapeptide) pyrophosphoryl-undecaprenol N-acetylglucosamine transferase
VQAELTAFIDDTAQAFAEADLIVCRAGASTVTEIAAVGAAALFVPFPSAVDDHQTRNARFLVDAGAAWLVPQPEFTPQALARMLRTVQREQLQEMAVKARQMQKTDAVAAMVAACEQLSKVKTA